MFHKSEFNRVSNQEMFFIWCSHNYKKQVCWTYWIFNQLLTCAIRKNVPLTHSHVITIIAKTLNTNFDDFDCVVECSYFTKQAFVRGEFVDASFHLVPAHIRSCWKGILHPYVAGHQDDEPYVRVDVHKEKPIIGDEEYLEEAPHHDAPFPLYPMHKGASGSSSHDFPIWEPVLENQREMQHQLNGMVAFNH